MMQSLEARNDFNMPAQVRGPKGDWINSTILGQTIYLTCVAFVLGGAAPSNDLLLEACREVFPAATRQDIVSTAWGLVRSGVIASDFTPCGVEDVLHMKAAQMACRDLAFVN